MAKKSGSKPLTKTEILRNISESTGLAKKDVVLVLDHLTNEIQKSLKGSGIGVFSIPGLVKIERRKVPARPAQKGVKNPFTGELQDRPAKPASVKVRVRALKNLKAMVAGSSPASEASAPGDGRSNKKGRRPKGAASFFAPAAQRTGAATPAIPPVAAGSAGDSQG